MLGFLWPVLHPLIMLLVYTFVFTGVFHSKWGTGPSGSTADFAILLFSGMAIHAVFAECVTRAPNLIINNPNFVKKVIFPLEILPCVTMGTALFNLALNSGLLLLAQLFLGASIPLTALLFPLTLFPLILATMGFSWFLASTGVFLRDIGQVTTIVTTVLMFLAPVFYPMSAFPSEYRWLLYFNPVTLPIEQSREVLLAGRLPDWDMWAFYTLAASLIAWLGLAWFQATRKGFADVL